MKTAVAVIFALFLSIAQGQTTDSLGTDNSPVLTVNEAAWLNRCMAAKRGDFDFRGKRVVFLSGGTGGRILSKNEYFKFPCTTSMLLLTEKEKKDSGGYDAFVFSCVKVFSGKMRRKTVHKLAELH